MMEREKACECEQCGVEKECLFVGNNDGNPLYICRECMQIELRKAFKMPDMKQSN